jgi:hypothetical protein
MTKAPDVLNLADGDPGQRAQVLKELNLTVLDLIVTGSRMSA